MGPAQFLPRKRKHSKLRFLRRSKRRWYNRKRKTGARLRDWRKLFLGTRGTNDNRYIMMMMMTCFVFISISFWCIDVLHSGYNSGKRFHSSTFLLFFGRFLVEFQTVYPSFDS